MSMASPSSSQTSSGIFVNTRGLPLKVFIESVSVEDRRRLVKLLEKHGAQICYGVGDAHIILVNPDSEAGRNFARSWGKEPGKVVLNVIWAYKCKEQGRALLEDDSWGGFNDIDTTAYEDDDGVDADEIPDSEKKPQRKRKRSTERTPISRKMQPVSVAAPSPSAAGPSQLQASGPHSISDILTMNTATQPLQLPLPPNFSPFPQQPQSMGAMAYTNSNVPVHFWTPDLLRSFFSNAEALRIFSQQYGQPLFHPVPTLLEHPKSQSIAQAPPISANSRVDTLPPASEQRHGSSLSEEEIERDIQPSLRRRKERNNSDKIHGDGGSISARNSRPRETQPLLHNDSEARSSASGSSASMNNGGRHPSSSTERSQRSTQPSSSQISQVLPSGGMFTEDGEQMKFYVQTDLRERQHLLSMIKKNGGDVTSDMEVASYVILSSDEKPHSKKLLKTATSYDRTALKYHFIQACVKEGNLVDVEPYALNQVRGRAKQRKVETQPEASPKRWMPSTNSRHCDCRSLSPFAGTPQPSKNGVRYAYTREEEEYASKALRHILVRDGNFTTEGFAEVLYARMPVHSRKSWISTLTKDRYHSLIRRERNKHFNLKTEDTSDHENTLVNDEDESTQRTSADSACMAVGGVPSAGTSFTENDETGFKSDFETIVDFFCNKYMTTENKQWNDEQLWEELDSQHACSTEPSWKDFYSRHAKAVDTKLREDLRMQASADLPSDGPSVA